MVDTLSRKLRKAAGLGVDQWRLVLLAYLWTTVAWLGLRLIGYLRLSQAMLMAEQARRPRRGPSRLRLLVEAVDIASGNHILHITCLPRSLALCRLARSEGFAAQIRFGVTRTGADDFRAHAWVEVDGEVVGDRHDVADEFARLEGAAEMGAE